VISSVPSEGGPLRAVPFHAPPAEGRLLRAQALK
jgi:hypothetical protein